MFFFINNFLKASEKKKIFVSHPDAYPVVFLIKSRIVVAVTNHNTVLCKSGIKISYSRSSEENKVCRRLPYLKTEFTEFTVHEHSFFLNVLYKLFSVTHILQSSYSCFGCRNIYRPGLTAFTYLLSHFLIRANSVSKPYSRKSIHLCHGFDYYQIRVLFAERYHGILFAVQFCHIKKTLIENYLCIFLFCCFSYPAYHVLLCKSTCGIVRIAEHYQVIAVYADFIYKSFIDYKRMRETVCHKIFAVLTQSFIIFCECRGYNKGFFRTHSHYRPVNNISTSVTAHDIALTYPVIFVYCCCEFTVLRIRII